jgi:hypothetical protein
LAIPAAALMRGLDARLPPRPLEHDEHRQMERQLGHLKVAMVAAPSISAASDAEVETTPVSDTDEIELSSEPCFQKKKKKPTEYRKIIMLHAKSRLLP